MPKFRVTLLVLTAICAALCYYAAMRIGLFDKHLPKSSGNFSSLPYRILTRSNSELVSENSGVTFSRIYPNAVWTHNDSGGKPNIYLISIETGKVLIEVALDGATNNDWEDITYYESEHKGGFIAIADVGDNHKIRRQYKIYLIPEPTLELTAGGETPKIQSKEWTEIPFKYETGPMNCEAVAFDPKSNSLILIQKLTSHENGTSKIFRLNLELDNQDRNRVSTATEIAEIDGSNYSALDISPNGQQMVLRVYNAAFFISKSAEQSWDDHLQTQPLPKWRRLPSQLQGEGACFFPDGQSVLLSSERVSSSLIQVPFPFKQTNQSGQKD